MDQMPSTILDVRNLRKWYHLGRGFLPSAGETVKAVDGVSFDLKRGEILGLVGESGSGKSTIGKTILRLMEPTSGSILFNGQDIAHLSRRSLKPVRQKMQMIFQDPFSSLNPRMTVEEIIAAPLKIQGRVTQRDLRRAKVEAILEMVGLAPSHANRYPHEFSGGQRQRVGIARALIMEPDLLVADEPVSALDVSIQAQIVRLLLDVRRRFGLSILFITHDLALVGHISDRIAVMYLGRVMEVAKTTDLFQVPLHPYTEALFSAAPVPDPSVRRRRIVLKGDIPSPLSPPSGCVFRTRCPYAVPGCAESVPELREVTPGRFKACIRDDLNLQAWNGTAPLAATA
jgi:oligopeptide/dipeptide ABC transporter ATP-binding protein